MNIDRLTTRISEKNWYPMTIDVTLAFQNKKLLMNTLLNVHYVATFYGTINEKFGTCIFRHSILSYRKHDHVVKYGGDAE